MHAIEINTVVVVVHTETCQEHRSQDYTLLGVPAQSTKEQEFVLPEMV